MSIAVCRTCSGYTDTDFDVEGHYSDLDNSFTCQACLEERVDHLETLSDDNLIAIYKMTKLHWRKEKSVNLEITLAIMPDVLEARGLTNG